jgi:hypothetical protein
MAVGLFLEAEILGRRLDEVVVLPRSALRADRQVLVVDASARLRFRAVEVIRVDRGQVLVRAGIAEGDRVCVSPLEAAVDGMRVRTVLFDEASGAPEAPGASRGADSVAWPDARVRRSRGRRSLRGGRGSPIWANRAPDLSKRAEHETPASSSDTRIVSDA